MKSLKSAVILASTSVALAGCIYHPTKKPLYCVIDLSGGPEAKRYEVSYLASVPEGGWTDEYKTTSLVLRLVEPGALALNDGTSVSVAHSYYIGVFEVTQRQYELVMGSNPAGFKGDKRPVESVAFSDFRGDGEVVEQSFVGKLRARTGIATIDLPTGDQWEYACRAGTSGEYSSGSCDEESLKRLGRYNGNRYDGRGGFVEHTTVGSYEPNAWGIYDMHGNVWEWNRDRQDGKRGLRGGCWYFSAEYSRNSYRDNWNTTTFMSGNDGFRISM